MKFHYEGMKNFVGVVNDGVPEAAITKSNERKKSNIKSRSSFNARTPDTPTGNNKYQES